MIEPLRAVNHVAHMICPLLQDSAEFPHGPRYVAPQPLEERFAALVADAPPSFTDLQATTVRLLTVRVCQAPYANNSEPLLESRAADRCGRATSG